MTTPEDVPTRYNRLLDLETARQDFRNELALAFPNQSFDQALKQLLSELAPVLSDENGQPTYAVWLLHRHYELENGELMVTRSVDSNEEIMQPMDETLTLIFPERWDNLGGPLEHRQLAEGDTPLPPPSNEIWSSFGAIMSNRQITMLGISFAPDKGEMAMLEQGFVFLETISDNRSHIVQIVRRDSIVPTSITTTGWIARTPPPNDSFTMAELADGASPVTFMSTSLCSHVCTLTSHGGYRADLLPLEET